jgi:hypothetical protein
MKEVKRERDCFVNLAPPEIDCLSRNLDFVGKITQALVGEEKNSGQKV